MSNSKLATYARMSPNVTKPRQGTIKGVAVHCTAGGQNMSAKDVANMSRFTTYNAKNGASCHYIVGGDGSIAQVCDEANRAWCTSNPIDHYLVTIEVCSNADGTSVNPAAYNALINLLVDIVKRNSGIGGNLRWKANKSLMGNWSQQNMVVHRWTSDKACPGEYLYSRHYDIMNKVNAKLNNTNKKEDDVVDIGKMINEMTNEQAFLLLQKAVTYMNAQAEPDWSNTEGHWKNATAKGIVNGEGPERYVKRDEMIAVLGRKGLL